MKVYRWILFNGLLVATIWFGFIKGINGAQNFAIFLAWWQFFGALGAHTQQGQSLLKRRGLSVPYWLDVTLDVDCLAVLIWAGAWVTSIVFAMHILIAQRAIERAFEPNDGTVEHGTP